jgi:hypothetical protein
MTSADLIDALARALRDEEQARAEVRRAMSQQAILIRQLRAAGLDSSRVAHRVAVARGVALSVGDRRRLAERLRGRARRWTVRPVDSGWAPGNGPLAGSPSDERAIVPAQEEEDMAKRMIRRTTTIEEIVDPDALDGIDDAEDLTEQEEDEPEEETDGKRRRRRR